MTDQENDIVKRGEQITQLVLDSRLNDALSLVSLQMEGVTDWQLVSSLEDLNREYGYMLQYFGSGAADESRHIRYASLQARTYVIGVDATIARLARFSMTLFCQKLRQKVWNTCSIETLRCVFEDSRTPVQEHENSLEQLFDLIWTGPRWTRQDARNMTEICESPLISKSNALFAISAVLMSLFERFDTEKIMFLCHFGESQEPELAIRSLTALTLVTLKYGNVLPLFPQLTSRIGLIEECSQACTYMSYICQALLMTRQTSQIDRRMREEIIPSMLASSKLGDLMNDALDDNDSENPDWQQRTDKARDCLIEMTELQMEGADVYMSTFSNLKNYPFFRKLCNWFRVFSMDQPDVCASLGDSGLERTIIARSMLSSGTFCNSDKYSFVLTFSGIPQEQRELIAHQLESQFDQEQLEALEKVLPDSNISDRQATRQYCQDLYRFFNLFSRRHEFFNPFKCNLNLLENKYLAGFFKSSGSNYDIASWLLKKNYFDESARLFTALEIAGDSHCTDYRFYQQMGYALQKNGQWELSADAYSKADLLEAGNSWTLRHFAASERVIGNLEHALELLLEAEHMDKDNMSLQIQIGECLVDMKRYDDALTRFYKVDYLKPGYPKAWRAIAWCAFLAGKHDRAAQYYSKLLQMDGCSGTDLLNAGHNNWVTGNMKQAIECYKKSLEALGYEQFMTEFEKDVPTLSAMGVDRNDFNLMKDCVTL